MPKQARKVYLFDLEGVELRSFDSAGKCAQHIGATPQAVTAGANRGSVVLDRYYVSHSQSFRLPKRKLARNPLLASAPYQRSVTPSLRKVLVDENELDMELTTTYLLGR